MEKAISRSEMPLCRERDFESKRFHNLELSIVILNQVHGCLFATLPIGDATMDPLDLGMIVAIHSVHELLQRPRQATEPIDTTEAVQPLWPFTP